MPAEMVTALVALITAIGTILATLFVKGRLGDVIAAKSTQETTAVEAMAKMLDKAIDGLVKMAVAAESMGREMAGHKVDSNLHWQSNRVLLKEIREAVENVAENQKALTHVIAEQKNVER